MGPLTQEDPIGIAGGLNLYGYANGDPINFSDPFGLCPWCIGGLVGFGVEFFAQTVAGNGYDPVQLLAATGLGMASGGLSVAGGVRTALRYAGQGAIGAAAGLAKSDGDYSWSEAGFNAKLSRA